MKNLATLHSIYRGISAARHQWAQVIIENLKEMGKEIKVLGDYYDPEDGWPEGLHIVIMDDDNYPQDIVIDSVKYEEKEHSNIAVHLCYWDPNKCDQWWSISDFSSDDADTILLAIQWPESIKQGEAIVTMIDNKPVEPEKKEQEQGKVIERYDAIKNENKELVSYLIPTAIKNEQAIYGELSDWLRDYHNDLTLQEREVLCKMLLGDMVIHHPDWISRIKPNKVMALCRYNQDGGDGEAVLVVSTYQFKNDKERVREAIEGLWDMDAYDEDDLAELRECINDLLKGEAGVFGNEYYWEEKEAIL